MKKILKWVGLILGLLISSIVILGFLLHEKKPEGTQSTDADALARKMMTAINKAAWDTTNIVQWTFRGKHDYLWDRQRNLVKIEWKNVRVLLNTETVTGKIYWNGVERSGKQAEKLMRKAWSYFCNDSFWLNAPAKVFDPGTVRSLVNLNDGREGLMVVYKSGGVTPGDSYIWILDESGLPLSYKMWVKILPVGGLEITWEDWMILPTGAKIATTHNGKLTGFSIKNIKGAADLATLGLAQDPFAEISKSLTTK